MIPNIPTLGIRFDIDKLHSAGYGVAAWEVFWAAVHIENLKGGTLLFEGDTDATLSRKENVFCIAVQSPLTDLGAIQTALEQSADFQDVAASPPFIGAPDVLHEPLLETGRIDSTGNLLGDAYWARMALTNHLKRSDMSPNGGDAAISFGEATRIIKYYLGNEKRFQNQVKFLKAAVESKQYPNVQILALKKSNPSASCEYLLVQTGDKKEYLREMNEKSREEIFARVHPGKNWGEMWGDETVMDTPPKNADLTSTEPFDKIVREIKKGYYSKLEILSKEGQSDNLNALEMEAHATLESLAPEGIACTCGKTHSVDELVDAYVGQDGDYISYICPDMDPMDRVLEGRKIWSPPKGHIG